MLVCFHFMFKIVDIDNPGHGVNNPVFPHSGGAVFVQLNAVIHVFRSWGSNFDDPVRSSVAAFFIQPVGFADNGNVRFHIVSVVCVQENCKGSRIDPAGTMFGINEITDLIVESGNNFLKGRVL